MLQGTNSNRKSGQCSNVEQYLKQHFWKWLYLIEKYQGIFDPVDIEMVNNRLYLSEDDYI